MPAMTQSGLSGDVGSRRHLTECSRPPTWVTKLYPSFSAVVTRHKIRPENRQLLDGYEREWIDHHNYGLKTIVALPNWILNMSSTPEANDCLEIYESRVRLAIFVAMGIIMTAGALFMTGACIGVLFGFLGPPRSTVGELVGPVLASLIGIVGIIMFGLVAVQGAVRWSGSHRPVLFMTRDGFKDIRISADWIPMVRDPVFKELPWERYCC